MEFQDFLLKNKDKIVKLAEQNMKDLEKEELEEKENYVYHLDSEVNK